MATENQKTERLSEAELKETNGGMMSGNGNMASGNMSSGSGSMGGDANTGSGSDRGDWMFGDVFEEGSGPMGSGGNM